MKNRILHVMIADEKFTIPLVNWMRNQTCFDNHDFLIFSNGLGHTLKINNINVINTPFKTSFFRNIYIYYKLILKSDKIILHALPFLALLYLVPWKWKNTSWVIHGSDLYGRIKKRKSISLIDFLFFRKIKSHITHIDSDSQLANKHFKANVKFHYSPMYLSNVLDDHSFIYSKNKTKEFVVLVGNSLSYNNNHLELFTKISKHQDSIKEIICPLSYGYDLKYRDDVIEAGKRIFGNKFIPVIEFMPLEEYKKVLENIDIAIFDHWRQEAMGVTLSLLSLGKTVYMRSSTESFKSLQKRGFLIFDNQLVFENSIELRDTSNNKKLISQYYSIEVLKNSLLSL